MIKPLCPRCEISLESRSSHGIFQYTCPSCFGFAIPFGGLRKAIRPVDVARLWRESETADANGGNCSHCRKPMRLVYHGRDQSGVELDICRNCYVAWLDTGEWKDLEEVDKVVRRTQSFDEVKMQAQYAKALLDLEKSKTDYKSHVPSEPENLHILKTVVAMVGLPVEEQDDEWVVKPWATWILIALCVSVSSLLFLYAPNLIEVFAYRKGLFFPGNLFFGTTSFFVHGSWMHLLSNMYFLWIFGDNVEDHLRHGPYLILVFLSTMFGHMAYTVLDPRAEIMPSVGASGGIAGIMAYYLIRFPKRRFVFRYFLFRLIAIPGYMFGVLYLLKELLGAFMQMKGMTSVSHLAHLGGAFVGAFFAYYYSPKRGLEDVE